MGACHHLPSVTCDNCRVARATGEPHVVVGESTFNPERRLDDPLLLVSEFVLIDATTLRELRRDKVRLDYLEAMLAKRDYTGRCVLRWSSAGRGFRLHETSGYDREARETVRAAIDAGLARGLLEEGRR